MADMRHSFVNTQLIDRTIQSIKKRPFDMRCWEICICGHMLRIEGKTADQLCSTESFVMWGKRKLGISEEQALDLFQTNMSASRRDAIRCLEILRDEGIVDWDRASGGRVKHQLPFYQMTDAVAYYRQAQASIDELHADFDRLCEEAKALAR